MTESGRRRGLDAGGSSRDAPDSQARRDARRGLGPADEGGWRNVGMTREGEWTRSVPFGWHAPPPADKSLLARRRARKASRKEPQ